MNKLLFNNGWSFALKKIGELPEISDFKPVDVPHDWMVFKAKDLYGNGDGYYTKKFNLFDVDKNRYTVRFEGVYMDSEIYLNGEKIYEWKYGYTTFDVPLLNAREGENEISVRVRYQAPNSRWYSGAGIYRDVWLYQKGENEILLDGTYVTAKKGEKFWTLEVDTEVKGNSKNATLAHLLFDENGGIVAYASNDIELGEDVKTVSAVLNVADPKLWHPDTPNLYKLKTELLVDGESVDFVEENVGFKTIRFDCNEGFFINGESLKINGVCMHHDLGALGAAVNKTALRRQFESLKEMGVNSIRTSHNPPSVTFMELADEMGLMIDSEAFDMWELKKTDYDYGNYFPEWHERDVASWVRRDRNHPSIIMWSIGNEIYDTHAGPRGVEVTKMLSENVYRHDYKKMYPVTIGSNYMQWQGAQNCAEEIGTVGYNYTERIYDDHHAKHPDWCIYGSETASTVQSRGTYHFPAAQSTTTHDDHQCSSLMNCATGWGAISCEYNITQDRNHKFSAGQYIWTGWDYIGEPTPYWTKNSYFGHSDTAGFPKDTYYAYKAEWNKKAEPFVHVFPYWDFNEGQLIDLFIYSNCAKSELFVNGESKGVYEHNHVDGDKLTGRWQIPYHKGEIKAIGYDENGNKVCEMTRYSFTDAKEISLKPDKEKMNADGVDMIFVEISMLDKDGHPVENDRSRVNVTVSGAGRLVGLDNGDSTDYDEYKGTSRKLFNGKLLAMIASKKEAGEITVTVESKELPTKTIKLLALPCETCEGVCASTENEKSVVTGEINVRKLDLSIDTTVLTQDKNTVLATIKLYPENTTVDLSQIGFKVISDAGIETNLASVEQNGLSAVITAKGDGAYRLRAYCKNGSPYEEIVSEIEMRNEGFGLASFDPYSNFICASLKTNTSVPMQDVFEGGLKTPDKIESYIEFKNVDFGKYGSDEFTIGLYHNSGDPIPFDIADGEGNVIASYVYTRPRWWNHYQYETHKLPYKLVGVNDLRFIFRMPIHFRGFKFSAPTRVDEVIRAVDCDGIYGDTFTVNESYIGHIGNNVTVEFNGFDFGEDGVTKIEITGKTYNANDTVHVRFVTPEGQINQIVEFANSDEIETKCFELEKVCKTADLKLVFLPGCDFDLESIKFIK